MYVDYRRKQNGKKCWNVGRAFNASHDHQHLQFFPVSSFVMIYKHFGCNISVKNHISMNKMEVEQCFQTKKLNILSSCFSSLDEKCKAEGQN